jgi:hypothetical protein
LRRDDLVELLTLERALELLVGKRSWRLKTPVAQKKVSWLNKVNYPDPESSKGTKRNIFNQHIIEFFQRISISQSF